MRLLQNPTLRRSAATVAQVTFSEGGDFGAVGAAERRAVPVFAPAGVSYIPREGDNLLMVEADGADVCAGVLTTTDGLSAGELRLTSAGGACIRLHNSGEVTINGLTITKEGELRT